MSESIKSRFFEVSSLLTGFDESDLHATGVGNDYFNELVHGAGEDNTAEFLKSVSTCVSTDELRLRVWEDQKLGPMARNVILMWYLGSWYSLSTAWYEKFRPQSEAVVEHVVSAAAYKEGLVWLAADSHPRGAKPPGFGSWSRPPTRRNSTASESNSRKPSSATVESKRKKADD